jgi:[ribosomal protein S5]-alanine N-acetyltransferase
MSATPRLEAARAILRPLTRADAPALFIAMSDPVAQHYRRQTPHQNVAETERYIDETLRKGFGWAITVGGGEALGRIALRVAADTGEIGIILRGEAQGYGLASTAVRLVQDFAFDVQQLKRLRAEIDRENARSLLLFEHLGFARTELIRASDVTHKGVRDTIVVVKEAG